MTRNRKRKNPLIKKLSHRLELELQEIKEKLSQKRAMKKSDKIHEKVGRIKEKLIWLGIFAYQIVNFTRKRLQENGINYCWTTIKEKMRSMQSSTVMVDNDKNEKLYVKLCTRPTKDQKDIFSALSFKERPFVRKTKLVPQM